MFSFLKRFKRKDYKKLYEEQKKVAEQWEFKYNKLSRKIAEVLKECNLK